MTNEQQAGAVTRMTVGDIEVITLSDGMLDLPLTLFPDAAAAAADTAFGPGPFPTPITGFAIRSADRLYVVDAGSGPSRGPATGHLTASMAAAGLDPADVDAVLMTHLHGDHAGGLRDGSGAVFPKAELLVSETEARFWRDPGLPARAPERMQPTIATANAALAAYAGRTTLFTPGRDVVPGVAAVALPGHTPGQTGFRIMSGAAHVLIWADIVHVAAIQFPHPDWTIGFDVDGAEAVATRLRIFDEVSNSGETVLGMHLALPSSGRVERSGGVFAWRPDTI